MPSISTSTRSLLRSGRISFVCWTPMRSSARHGCAVAGAAFLDEDDQAMARCRDDPDAARSGATRPLTRSRQGEVHAAGPLQRRRRRHPPAPRGRAREDNGRVRRDPKVFRPPRRQPTRGTQFGKHRAWASKPPRSLATSVRYHGCPAVGAAVWAFRCEHPPDGVDDEGKAGAWHPSFAQNGSVCRARGGAGLDFVGHVFSLFRRRRSRVSR
jgi:hypothetical protein